MSVTSDLTTIVEVGAVIRYRQPVSGVVIHGTVRAFVDFGGVRWMKVTRRADGKIAYVGKDEIITLVRNGVERSEEAIAHSRSAAPVIEEVPAVMEAPVIVEVPRVAPPVVVWDAEIGDKVRYRSPYGCMKVGVVVEVDTVSAMIEVGRPSTLELIDLGDIEKVLEAA